MRVAIDASGRIVVPKALRDALGVAGATELELSARDGHLELAVPSRSVRIEDGPHGPVAVTDQPMPALSTDLVRDVLERTRR